MQHGFGMFWACIMPGTYRLSSGRVQRRVQCAVNGDVADDHWAAGALAGPAHGRSSLALAALFTAVRLGLRGHPRASPPLRIRISLGL